MQQNDRTLADGSRPVRNLVAGDTFGVTMPATHTKKECAEKRDMGDMRDM